MHPKIETLVISLQHLGERIASHTDGRTYTELSGWNSAPLSSNDLSKMVFNLKERITKTALNDLNEEEESVISMLPQKIDLFIGVTLPHLSNGHAHQAVPVFLALMDYIKMIIDPVLTWENIDTRALPKDLLKRLRSIESNLKLLEPRTSEVQNQLDLIQSAYNAAEDLPTTLNDLSEAKEKIDKAHTDSAVLLGKIDTIHNNVSTVSDLIDKKEKETSKLVKQCEEAYRITTTTGLAGSFDQKAKKLNNSVIIWVIGLLVSLGVAAIIGSMRLDQIYNAIQTKQSIGFIWIQVFLSVISLGAPIWFAWLATKQINQRFKLAEDYGFKASVAKAYEGYRKEAARIDPDLESRLFESALTRLDEAPLRHIESSTHGSPWHEFFQSDPFKKALDRVPNLKELYYSIRKQKGKSDDPEEV